MTSNEQSAAEPIDSGRRSTRIRAQIPLRITSLDPAVTFSEAGHTLVLNTQGCGVRLSRALESLALRRADQVTTICEGLREDIASRGVPSSRGDVLT